MSDNAPEVGSVTTSELFVAKVEFETAVAHSLSKLLKEFREKTSQEAMISGVSVDIQTLFRVYRGCTPCDQLIANVDSTVVLRNGLEVRRQ